MLAYSYNSTENLNFYEVAIGPVADAFRRAIGLLVT